MKRYESYKDSNIPWIGNLPKRWQVKKIKHSCYVKGRIGWHGLNTNDYQDEGAYLVTGTNFADGEVDWNSCHNISLEKYDEDPYIQLKSNDLLITKDGTIGKVALVDNLKKEATLNSGIFLVRPLIENLDTAYLKYVIESSVFKRFFDYSSTGATIQHLYQVTFNGFSFPLPEQEEQRAIVRYLDKKLEQIDTFIQNKRRLIALLEEQKSALINRAVTKGLDEGVEMKDSGVEWVESFPSHWSVKRVKQVSRVISKGTTPSTEGGDLSFEGPITFLKAENIQTNDLRIKKEPIFKIDEKTNQLIKRSVLQHNDVLFVIAGATLGKVGVVSREIIPANTNQAVAFIRPGKYIKSSYLGYWLLSSRIKEITWLNAVQSAQPNLSMVDLGNFPFLHPPLQEQEKIVNYIEKEIIEKNEAISNTDKEIQLINEYRTTLISEVVTGKIDVRTAA